MALPGDFQQACLEHGSYPKSLVRRTAQTYSDTIKAYQDHLDLAEELLFETDQAEWQVYIKDILVDSDFNFPQATTIRGMSESDISNSEELSNWLGLQLMPPKSPDQPKLSPIAIAHHKDPVCRFVYIYGVDSRSPLKISREMLTKILTFHQVMPQYLDFMTVFGDQDDPPDIRFAGFREQIHIGETHDTVEIPSLGRSGRYYQLCYNLKSMNLIRDPEEEHYLRVRSSIRQAAIHHQFDIYGKVLWIVTRGGQDLQKRFQEHTEDSPEEAEKRFRQPENSYRSSLLVHLLFCQWSTEGWQAYLRCLGRKIEEEAQVIRRKDPGIGDDFIFEDLQRLYSWKNCLGEATTAIQGNIEVMSALSRFYNKLSSNGSFTLPYVSGDTHIFTAQIDELVRDFEMELRQSKALTDLLDDGIQLMVQYLLEQSRERKVFLDDEVENISLWISILTLVVAITPVVSFLTTLFSFIQSKSTYIRMMLLIVVLVIGLSLYLSQKLIRWGTLGSIRDCVGNAMSRFARPKADPVPTTDAAELPSTSSSSTNSEDRNKGKSVADQKKADVDQNSTSKPALTCLENLSNTLSQQNVPIALEHERLRNYNEGSSESFSQRQQDQDFQDFCKDRDIVLLLDNSSTMREHWNHVALVTNTLAMKFDLYSKSVITLRFTLLGFLHNIRRMTSTAAPALISDKIMSAMAPSDELETDMFDCLRRIFDDYACRLFKRKTTVVIFTDGLWQASQHAKNPLTTTIDFVKELKNSGDFLDLETLTPNFTIQFISFGHDEEGQTLLNDMVQETSNETCTLGVIDEEPWDGEVGKMVMGSVYKSAPGSKSRPTLRRVKFSTPLVKEASGSEALAGNAAGIEEGDPE